MIERTWHGPEDAETLVAEYFDPAYHAHDPFRPRPNPSSIVKIVREMREALADLRYSVHETVEQGDLLAARWTLTGVHRGTLFGVPASGNKIEVSGVTLNRYVNGKIVEGHIHWDASTLMRQIGGDAPPPA